MAEDDFGKTKKTLEFIKQSAQIISNKGLSIKKKHKKTIEKIKPKSS